VDVRPTAARAERSSDSASTLLSYPAPGGDAVARPIRRGRGLGRFVNRRTLLPIACASVVLLTLIAAIAAPVLAPFDPTDGLLQNRLKPPGWSSADGVFLLGTDQQGRDILSRLIFGAQVTMLVGVGSVLLSGGAGILIGLIAGYFGGWLDRLITVIVDIQLSFPFLCLAIALVAVIGAGITNVTIVLALSAWVLYARIVRGEVQKLRRAEFVLAARSLGATDWRLLFSTILPNVWAPVIVIATFTFAQMVIAEASLSFLGVGIQPPTPTWGGMINDARQYMAQAWWLAGLPGAALLVLVLAVNLLGDWLRDVLDPRLKV
jgi:peptide/nickel transport system permease protein